MVLPEGLAGIEKYTFCGCSSLTDTDLPAAVTGVSDSAFFNCTSLTSFGIPACVTRIGYAAFEGCTDLTSIFIPDSVTSYLLGDADGDGEITILDATAIQRHRAGLKTNESIGKAIA